VYIGDLIPISLIELRMLFERGKCLFRCWTSDAIDSQFVCWECACTQLAALD